MEIPEIFVLERSLLDEMDQNGPTCGLSTAKPHAFWSDQKSIKVSHYFVPGLSNDPIAYQTRALISAGLIKNEDCQLQKGHS